MTPAASVKDARDSSWVKKKTNLSSQSEVDYKKLALVNDDLLKVKNRLEEFSKYRHFIADVGRVTSREH